MLVAYFKTSPLTAAEYSTSTSTSTSHPSERFKIDSKVFLDIYDRKDLPIELNELAWTNLIDKGNCFTFDNFFYKLNMVNYG
jgi:hypothetical protein